MPPLRTLAGALVLACLMAAPATAQEELDDIFGGLGTAETFEEGEAAPGQQEGEGTIAGMVFDGDAGNPVPGVTVIVIWPDPEDGSEARQEVQVTDADGAYEFPSIPAGSYELSFVKSGYRAATMTDFTVNPGEINRADFPLPPLPTAASDDVLDLEAFVVEASTVGEMMTALELRMDSDALVDIMSAEDFSKFAASDVADALKRVAGVNVVEGQFAIIRGLEDRYSSTLFNSVVLPSPDPDRQSVQLDLFPSEIVSNLVVQKSFVQGSPSNSSGGTIDIVTSEYPQDFEFKVKAKTGFNDKALDGFLEFRRDNPVGNMTDGFTQVNDEEYGGFMGGRYEFFGREVRFKGIANYEVNHDTARGWRQTLQPKRGRDRSRFNRPDDPGDLTFGELTLTSGRFDQTESEKQEKRAFFAALGLDLDTEANHKIDGSFFYTKNETETVQARQDGFVNNHDYNADDGAVQRQLSGIDGVTFDNVFSGVEFRDTGAASLESWIARTRDRTNRSPGFGFFWMSNFRESKSFENDRDLTVYQLNGTHDFSDVVEGVKVRWAFNRAITNQDDGALGARFTYEPCGFYTDQSAFDCPDGVDQFEVPTENFPVTVEDIGPDGIWVAGSDLFFSSNDIEEKQWAGRFDASYALPLQRWTPSVPDWVAVEIEGGAWWESSNRDVSSAFLDQQQVRFRENCEFCFDAQASDRIAVGSNQEALGRNIFGDALATEGESFQGVRESSNDSEREINAWHFGGKMTFFEKVDLLAGVRVEDIRIESNNDPFVGGPELDGSPLIFPSKYVLFDRFDNVVREFFTRPIFNDEFLGINTPPGNCRGAGADPPPGQSTDPRIDPDQRCVDLATRSEIEDAVNGLIDEDRVLPAFGIAVRPIQGLTIRGAYSKTVARPSFREIGYYVSVEPGSDDTVVGNPQLGLSDVESWDGRIEYVFGEQGDLLAFSGFYKEIDDPIEQVLVRNPADFTTSSNALFRTFFNNPNQATLWGIEVEGRKNLGFIPELLGAEDYIGFLEYFTIGGNYTYIDAEVDRIEEELDRASIFYANGQTLDKSRRLFGQPEWIANADVTFDHPGWGSKVTLAVFAISDVLDAAGSAFVDTDGTIAGLTLDRYIGSFHTLDLIFRQELPWGFNFKFTAKNLTNSKRDITYDEEETSQQYKERELRVGRDFRFEVSWKFSGFPWER